MYYFNVVLFLAIEIRQNSIFVQHPVFLRHVAQQYTQNALLLFHCNNGYANAPQYYVIPTSVAHTATALNFYIYNPDIKRSPIAD